MKMYYSNYDRSGCAAKWVAPLVAWVLLAGFPGIAGAQYDGADSCAGCHSAQFEDWLTSGHRFMLKDSMTSRHRPIPVPPGLAWDDVSYTVGGHKNRVNYLDSQGYLLAEQYNMKTGEWSEIHSGGDVPYDCGACHTTGYDASGNQDGLPGFVGTFQLPGVQCEHCHGPGANFSTGMQPGSTDPAFCGECHSHGDENVVLAQDGFILSEGQYNEFLAGPHDDAGLGCVSCHNPHQTAEFGIKTECSSCHGEQAASYSGTLMASVGVQCDDCHMAPATVSGMPLGPKQGDMKSHVFNIETDASASMFTADGSQLALNDGEGAITLDFACQRCHSGTSLETLEKFAKDFHDPSKQFENVGFNPGLSGTWWGGEPRAGEGFLIEFAYIGDSLYFFGSFYTYDSVGNPVWLTFQPPAGSFVPESGTTMVVDAWYTDGAKWGDDFVPGEINREMFGSATFSFDSCTMGSISITPNQAFVDLGFSNLAYDLSRVFDASLGCPTFDNNSGGGIASN